MGEDGEKVYCGDHAGLGARIRKPMAPPRFVTSLLGDLG